MDTVATMTVALTAIGLSALAFVQLNRRENIADDFSDTDCRTTALAEMLGAGAAARETGGVGCNEQRPDAEDAIARHGEAYNGLFR